MEQQEQSETLSQKPQSSGDSNPEDLAWASGLFEGEGWIRQHTVKSQVYMEVGLQTCDLDVLERFVGVLRDYGVKPVIRRAGPGYESRIHKKKKREVHHKDAWTWKTAGNTAILAYELMRPHLGRRRTDKGDSTLAAREACIARTSAPRKCAECGEMFELRAYGKTRKFCSGLCSGRAKRRDPEYRKKNAARQARYLAKPEAIEKRRQRSREYELRRPPRKRIRTSEGKWRYQPKAEL